MGLQRLLMGNFFSKRSLTLRLVFFSTLWVMVALTIVAFTASVLYREANQQNFKGLLTAHLYSLIGFVNVSAQGNLQGKPELGDIRFSDMNSGWFWDVTPVTANMYGRLQSYNSVAGAYIQSPSEKQVPFDSHFMRSYHAKTFQEQDVLVVEGDVLLDQEGRVARFRIIGNLNQIDQQFIKFRNTMSFYLIGLGIATIIMNAIVIGIGLLPLFRVRKTLKAIRAGEADRLDNNLPLEIAPLAYEMNALIDNNQRIIERFRTQVGNLAHSLKTPLAVLSNEAEKIGSQRGHIIRQQSLAMQVQIKHYLERARIASQRDSVVYHTDIIPTLEPIIRVMRKLNPDKTIKTFFPEKQIIFAGEKEDIEEIIGNVMENAAKWANNLIKISAFIVYHSDKVQNKFEICIEDDGQGLNNNDIKVALKRGKRLDETIPGSGLGLSIVVDAVHEYGGELKLDRSSLGGLRIRIYLPTAQDL